MKEFIATFFTHSGAIKFHRRLLSLNIHCELMPVPRKLSSDCGIGAKFKVDHDFHSLVDDEVEKIFLMDDGYTLVYHQE